jgi:hypothetical protein
VESASYLLLCAIAPMPALLLIFSQLNFYL